MRTRDAWLQDAGWGDVASAPLAGDASARRYARLTRADGARAVLMRAPADGSTARFATIARHLRALGFSAPDILASDPAGDALALEDLGDGLFARCVAADARMEAPLYAAAVDFLAALHRHPAPDWLPAPDASAMAGLIEPAATWYLGHGAARPDALAAFTRALTEPLGARMSGPRILVHRDFHAENLIWLPDRLGAARVGLLDFQDAFAGPSAYDLVSLTRDARRDLAPGLPTDLLARYATASGTPLPRLEAACATLGAQRNLRILGVFARLSLAHGKARYVDLIPRVWTHLQRDLAHPDLADLKDAVSAYLDPPTSDVLATLRQRCGTIPAR